ncbi:hypothetical protein HZB02_06000, partial [Candidatus Woesearchaeota archaeon]|nr:hypothetical protein [Candidatus Woesearchaeota archaeon]
DGNENTVTFIVPAKNFGTLAKPELSCGQVQGSGDSGTCGDDRDGICPAGCNLFLDKDCPPTATINNFIATFLDRFLQGQQWYQDYVKTIAKLAGYMDPTTYAQSFCNPSSPWYVGGSRPTGFFDTTGNLALWFGAEKVNVGQDSTGKSLYLYTMTWHASGLQDDVIYRITMKTSGGVEKKIVPRKYKYYGLPSGGTHGGDLAARAFYSPYDFTEICFDINACSNYKEKAQSCKDYNIITGCKEYDSGSRVCEKGLDSYGSSYPNECPLGGDSCKIDKECRPIKLAGGYDYGSRPGDLGSHSDPTSNDPNDIGGLDDGVDCGATGEC